MVKPKFTGPADLLRFSDSFGLKEEYRKWDWRNHPAYYGLNIKLFPFGEYTGLKSEQGEVFVVDILKKIFFVYVFLCFFVSVFCSVFYHSCKTSYNDPPGVRGTTPVSSNGSHQTQCSTEPRVARYGAVALTPGDPAYNAQYCVFRALFRLDNSTSIIGKVISYKNNKWNTTMDIKM